MLPIPADVAPTPAIGSDPGINAMAVVWAVLVVVAVAALVFLVIRRRRR
jgi:hypothetical protein